MKIIFIIPNLGAGGAERVISILSDSFLGKSMNVDVILLQDNTISYSISDKVDTVYFDMNLLSCSKKLSCKILRDYFKKQKREHGGVVVIPFLDTCLKRALLATAGLNIPVIACERNDPYQKGNTLIARLKANLPYLMASHCVFQTPGAGEYYYSRVQKKGDIIMNPLVMSDDIIWKGQASKRIVSVGRLEPQKNQLMLIDAFYKVHQEYPEYSLEIYGEGYMKEILQSKIDDLHLNQSVILRGHSPNIPAILEDSYMFVMSSDYEGLSNALIEALAVGMPVVTTDHPCGGAKMLIKDGINGILVPTGDADSMAIAMKRVIESSDFACQIGENAYHIRELLSVEQITNKWIDMIQKL